MSSKRALFLTTYTPNNEVFWRSLEAVNGWEVIPHRYDDRPYERHGELVDLAKHLDPAVIVKVGALDETGLSNPVPKIDVLKRLKEVAPFVLLCGDASDAKWWPVLDDYLANECFDLITSMDGYNHRDSLLPKLTPVDTRPYLPKLWADRTVEIGCNGGSGGERGHMIGLLGAVTPGVVSSDEMARFLCNCKAVVNGPRNGTGNMDHVKGRVVETGFAGACLLERTNAATAQWFRPGLEYIEYDNPSDGVAKMQWIREHDDEAREIARRLHLRVNAEHHPVVFWGDVMGRLGVEL